MKMPGALLIKSMIKKSFYFVRHGETDWNSQNRCMGQLDIPLNDNGKNQAIKLKSKISQITFDKIFYSPLLRARETAEIIFKDKEIFKQEVDNLKEWHFGNWQNKRWDSLNIENIDQIYPPNGETKELFFRRTLNGINSCLENSNSSLIIAHSGTFWAICYYAKIENFNIKNCDLIQFIAPNNYNDNWKFEITLKS